MIRPSSWTAFVALLIVSLTVSCLSDLVEAAAPSAEHMECGGLLCDAVTGCETTAAKQVVPPVAVLVTARLRAVAAPPTRPVVVVLPPAFHGRQVVPPPPRSPPVA
jgi:hypothetical protein